MNRKLTLLLAGALAVGLIASGCGGDDGDDDSSDAASTAQTGTDVAGSLTKAEFLKEGNEICAQGSTAIDEGAKQLGDKPTADQLDEFVTGTLVPAVQGQIDGIEALPAPEGDEDQVTAILDAAQQGVDTLEDDPQALNGDAFAEANKLAAQYGLTECAS